MTKPPENPASVPGTFPLPLRILEIDGQPVTTPMMRELAKTHFGDAPLAKTSCFPGASRR